MYKRLSTCWKPPVGEQQSDRVKEEENQAGIVELAEQAEPVPGLFSPWLTDTRACRNRRLLATLPAQKNSSDFIVLAHFRVLADCLCDLQTLKSFLGKGPN